jgi:hypothetical protein
MITKRVQRNRRRNCKAWSAVVGTCVMIVGNGCGQRYGMEIVAEKGGGDQQLKSNGYLEKRKDG